MITNGKQIGSIFNNDVDGLLGAILNSESPVDDYSRGVHAMLDLQPGLLAQNVGWPDPVSYRSEIATNVIKYHTEVTELCGDLAPISVETAEARTRVLERILDCGTNPLQLTIDACRDRGVPVVASYRMNDEHWSKYEYLLSDFGRAHPETRIPATDFEKSEHEKYGMEIPEYTGVLDPLFPEVYQHRMKMFTEVANNYDIDGIELDFRRWYHLVSDPLENHPVLTQMVRDTRRVLDEAARKKSRDKMILGARVAPSLATEPSNYCVYPGSCTVLSPFLYNGSCRQLGLDVETWICEEIVDYVCPSLWNGGLPGLPKTCEFASLAEGTSVGIYPTIWNFTGWQLDIGGRSVGLSDDPLDLRAQALFKHDLCSAVLRAYEDGADGVSTFNWYCYLRTLDLKRLWHENSGGNDPGPGAEAIQRYVYPMLGNPDALRQYLNEPWAFRTVKG